MMTNMIKKPFGVDARPCAPIQGAPSRLHGTTVVLLASSDAPIQGGAVGDVKYGGPGSRAWSPPV
jgi:hypothetical protein